MHGFGVLGYTAAGLIEDHSGTSHAAPILAREAAFTLSELRKWCPPGIEPFAVTARAFLSLTAEKPVSDASVQSLVKRTLGYGVASVDRLKNPVNGTAVILWQGIIDSPRDKVRIQLPIPLDWLNQSALPILRLVVCGDPPVNEAATQSWACRRIVPRLYLGPDADAVVAPRGSHKSFPVIDRQYSLTKHKPGEKKAAKGDLWLLELSYDEIAPYPPGMSFDTRQRVAFAAELLDEGEKPVDPQPALAALQVAAAMNRLSVLPTATRTPVIIKSRL